MGGGRGNPFVLDLREFGGAFGDLGTLLPLMLGAIAVAGLAPAPVLLGFAAFYIGSALYYRLPIPVQPMKAVGAVILTAGATPAELAASGAMLGAALLLLGATGWIARIARLVPVAALTGLQVGLGATLGWMSLEMMAGAPVVAAVALAALAGMFAAPRWPWAPVALAASALAAHFLGAPGLEIAPAGGLALAPPPWPGVAELERAVSVLALPQLSLTVTNAVLVTALVAGDYFGDRAAHATPARLSITSGLANLLLTPLGAQPMCHGAGGLAAHYRFGARTGTAPLLMGAMLAALAVLPAGPAAIAAIPAAGLGALLLAASIELALSKRLFESAPALWPAIAVSAGVTVWTGPFWGLLAGCAAELARRAGARALGRAGAGGG